MTQFLQTLDKDEVIRSGIEHANYNGLTFLDRRIQVPYIVLGFTCANPPLMHAVGVLSGELICRPTLIPIKSTGITDQTFVDRIVYKMPIEDAKTIRVYYQPLILDVGQNLTEVMNEYVNMERVNQSRAAIGLTPDTFNEVLLISERLVAEVMIYGHRIKIPFTPDHILKFHHISGNVMGLEGLKMVIRKNRIHVAKFNELYDIFDHLDLFAGDREIPENGPANPELNELIIRVIRCILDIYIQPMGNKYSFPLHAFMVKPMNHVAQQPFYFTN